MKTDSSVQIGTAGNTVWLRVNGRGSFQNSRGLKEAAAEMTRRGHRDFIIDLHDCELMDSTFMGTLAGLAFKLRPDGGRLRVIHANERCRGVLQNLGLDRVMDLDDDAVATAPALREAAATPADREQILEAHQNLVAAHPDNAVRFKDVLEFLAQSGSDDQAQP